MNKRDIIFHAVLTAQLLMILLLQTGCTRTETTGRASSGVQEVQVSIPEPLIDEGLETAAIPIDSVYNLDDEALVDDVIEDTAEKVDIIHTGQTDSFSVRDAAEGPAEKPGFEMGYRVQIFASGDLEAAKELRKKVMAGTGLAVYIDYEGGLYKVRAGDFLDREGAAKARAVIVDQYPDCWIVKTTIKK